jgi:hypothetical protein
VSRPARPGATLNKRDRLKLESTRAAPLREIYPQLAELRVEFEFDDGTPLKPSAQVISYFPAARGFFRYSCPCHSCSGEFDLSELVAELAGKPGRTPRVRNLNVSCTGQRAREADTLSDCPICAQVRVSATPHGKEQST